MIDFSAARQMATPAAATTTIVEEVKAGMVSQDPMFILTPAATIAVYGHEHVSKKVIEIFGIIMNLDDVSGGKSPADHNVRAIMLRADNQPKDDVGKAMMAAQSFGLGTIAINLVETLRVSVLRVEENPEVSIHHIFHNNLIMDLLHEVHHMIMKDEPTKDEAKRKETDAMAEEWAVQTRNFLVQNYNAEPPTFREEPFLFGNIMRILEAWEKDESKKELHRMQSHMLECHVMLTIPTDKTKGLPEDYVTSFKKVTHLMTGENLDGAEWNKPTDGMSMNTEQYLLSFGRQPSEPNNVMGGLPEVPWEEESPGFMNTVVNGEIPGFIQNPTAFSAPPTMAPAPVNVPATTFTPVSTWEKFTGNQSPLMGPVAAPVTLPATGLSPEEVVAAAMSVYAKCYNHIFTNCGQLVNSDLAFSNPEAVATMPIQLTPAEAKVVYQMDAMTAQGQVQKGIDTSAGLRGIIFSKSKLPSYTLYINDGMGKPTMRKLLPQNTANSSKPGVAARGGSRIMYIVEADPVEERALVARGESTFLYKVVDGQLQSCKG